MPFPRPALMLSGIACEGLSSESFIPLKVAVMLKRGSFCLPLILPLPHRAGLRPPALVGAHMTYGLGGPQQPPAAPQAHPPPRGSRGPNGLIALVGAHMAYGLRGPRQAPPGYPAPLPPQHPIRPPRHIMARRPPRTSTISRPRISSGGPWRHRTHTPKPKRADTRLYAKPRLTRV